MKIIMIEDTFIPNPLRDKSGPQFLGRFSMPDVETEAAHRVVAGGKALYVEKKDDPQKGALTADQALIDAAAAAAKELEAKAKPKAVA